MALLLDGLAAPEPELVAGRYEIEASIAKGGMGEVFRAHDRALGRRVALKRLILGNDARRRTRMFEREFHALAELKHPRIVEVYDYGIDARGAYYTMELLDGRDLRELAPLPWRQACRCLRDVASALGLLHARNFLHRDVSPRNVRVTSDGRAMLIDFGALSSFGRNPTLVGTAPGIPPEALHGEMLDQRTDLYALGALGYWMLTARHAYDVRTMDELAQVWTQPLLAPSVLAPRAEASDAIPEDLDNLITGLLSLNPRARPVSAAEVISRLTAIGQLEADDESLSVQSYFHGGRTVGRARERAKLRRRVRAALRGTGAVLAIEAEAGMGGGRLLGDLAIEARLLGATAVVVDAALQRGPYGVIEPIAHALLTAHPDKARAAMGDHAALLARFLPETNTRPSTRPTALRPLAPKADRASDPRENRLRMQEALLAWLTQLAEEVPLVLAVHHATQADDSSAALLSTLAHGIEQRRILLVLTHDPENTEAQAPALASLKQSAERLQLRGLQLAEVHALVEATFGPVPHSARLAASLHELAAGKPQGCLDLMQHLVEQNVIRFIDGAWVLPQELSPDELPADLGQALELRLSRLSPSALRFARALSVHRGPLPLERCVALAKLERIDEPLKLLPELQQRCVLVLAQDALRFSHARVRDALCRQLEEPERRRLHGQFGALIARENSSDPETLLDAGWHLLHGGHELDGARLLAELGMEMVLDADNIPSALPGLLAALATYRKLGRPAREQAHLLGAIAHAAFLCDRKLFERYADPGAALLQNALGLSLAGSLRPLFGLHTSTWIGLAYGFFGYLFAYGPRRAYAQFTRAMMLFVTLGLSIVGHAALTLDGERGRRGARSLEPLRALGPNHVGTWIADLAQALSRLPEDRVAETAAGCRRVAERLAQDKPLAGITAEGRAVLRATAQYAWGALETFCENPEALRIADELDQSGLKVAELFANQIRANHHGLRGEVALERRYVRRVELYALQAGSAWLAEVWAPTSLILSCNLTGDVVGIRSVIGELDRLAAEIPSLRRHAQLARSTYLALAGDMSAAHRVGAPLLLGCEPRSFMGWTASMAGYMGGMRSVGDIEQARLVGLRVLSLFDADDMRVTTMITPVIVALAAIEAELGDLDGAARRLDAALADMEDGGGPVTRGNLHEARAQVALLAGDIPLARQHCQLMRRLFLPTENPALVGRCEHLLRVLENESGTRSGTHETLDLGLSSVHRARTQLQRCQNDAERHGLVLSLLLEHAGGRSGFLFSCEGSAVSWVAPREGDAPPAAAQRCAEAALERFLQADSQATSMEPLGSDSLLRNEEAAAEYRPFLLTVAHSRGRDSTRVVAIAVLATSPSGSGIPPHALLDTLAAGLAEPYSASSQTRLGKHRTQ